MSSKSLFEMIGDIYQLLKIIIFLSKNYRLIWSYFLKFVFKFFNLKQMKMTPTYS